jgi:hypothetical protein
MGVSQRKIGERLGVPEATLRDWLVRESRKDAETESPEPLPAQDKLDAVAAARGRAALTRHHTKRGRS